MKFKEGLVGLVAALTIGSGCHGIRQYEERSEMPPDRTVVDYENNNNSLDEDTFEEAMRSVEMIRVTTKYSMQDPFIEQEDSTEDNIQEAMFAGSCIVLFTRDGFDYVLTSFHVINVPDTIPDFFYIWNRVGDIKISIGGSEDIELVYYNEILDFALLRTPRNDALYPLTQNDSLYMGDSNSLRIGDFLCIAGYPLAAGNFLTQGYVTNLGEFELDYEWPFDIPTNSVFLFQTPLNNGNSGGPLLTVYDGKLYLVGITTGYIGENMNVGVRINEIINDMAEPNVEIPSNIYRLP